MTGLCVFLERTKNAIDDIDHLRQWLIKNNLESSQLVGVMNECEGFFEESLEFYELQIESNFTINEALEEIGFETENLYDSIHYMIDML